MSSKKLESTNLYYVPLRSYYNYIRNIKTLDSIDWLNWESFIQPVSPTTESWKGQRFFDTFDEAKDYVLTMLKKRIIDIPKQLKKEKAKLDKQNCIVSSLIEKLSK